MWTWFNRLALPAPMGGPPTVPGGEFLKVCNAEGWDVDAAFALLEETLKPYYEKADEADKK